MSYTEEFGGEAPTNTAVAEVEQNENTGVSTQTADNTGGFDLSDMFVPRLNICQPTSSDVEGDPGDLVIDKTSPAYNVGVKAPCFILSIKKGWKEDVEYESSDMPRFANSEAEAKALQLELKAEGSDRKVIHFAEVIFFIQHTPESVIDKEDAADAFPYSIGGEDYALVKATFQKTAYDGTARRIVNVQVSNPGVDLTSVPFTLSTAEKRSGKNKWFTPTFQAKITEKAPAELLAFVARLKGGAQ